MAFVLCLLRFRMGFYDFDFDFDFDFDSDNFDTVNLLILWIRNQTLILLKPWKTKPWKTYYFLKNIFN